mmetsp:Transcript_78605/g.109217  ORF Transcript_78605/g.109217 Transcript_78605/m.109217 type:complete len:88 (+) Transcript_78605:54-317(+)
MNSRSHFILALKVSGDSSKEEGDWSPSDAKKTMPSSIAQNLKHWSTERFVSSRPTTIAFKGTLQMLYMVARILSGTSSLFTVPTDGK